MKIFVGVFVAAVVIGGFVGWAQSQIIPLGAGSQSCGEWIAKSEKGRTPEGALIVSWVQGYVLGTLHLMGRATSADDRPSPQWLKAMPDAPTIELWLTTECRQNPLSDVWQATDKLASEVFTKVRKAKR